MKKRIGSKLYDTETSELICTVKGDRLYRKSTRNREWFLLTAEGKIRPLNEVEDQNIIEVGEAAIGNESKPAKTTIWVDRDTHSKLSAFAKEWRCSISDVVRKLVQHLVLILKL